MVPTASSGRLVVWVAVLVTVGALAMIHAPGTPRARSTDDHPGSSRCPHRDCPRKAASSGPGQEARLGNDSPQSRTVQIEVEPPECSEPWPGEVLIGAAATIVGGVVLAIIVPHLRSRRRPKPRGSRDHRERERRQSTEPLRDLTIKRILEEIQAENDLDSQGRVADDLFVGKLIGKIHCVLVRSPRKRSDLREWELHVRELTGVRFVVRTTADCSHLRREQLLDVGGIIEVDEGIGVTLRNAVVYPVGGQQVAAASVVWLGPL